MNSLRLTLKVKGHKNSEVLGCSTHLETVTVSFLYTNAGRV